MDDLTETSLSSEQLVDGVLLKAFRDEVRLPDGGDGRKGREHRVDGCLLARVLLEHPAGKRLSDLVPEGIRDNDCGFLVLPCQVFVVEPSLSGVWKLF